MSDSILKADGFEAAFIGIIVRCGQLPLYCYDYELALQVLMKRDKMERGDAIEFMEFNVVGAWVGQGTPAFLNKCTLEEAEEWYVDPENIDSKNSG
jgi:hypothetical protein